MKKNRILGDYGELLAENYIKKLGYTIIDKKFISKFGEIDIIARNKNTIRFIEVKTRKNKNPYLPPEIAVNKKKMKSIIKIAQFFIYCHPELSNYELHFDIIAINLKPEKNINYIEDAFILS